MPNLPGAAKRLRQNEKRRVRNKARKSELKTLSKRLERAIHDGHKDEAEQLFRRLSKRLDQAADKRVIHPNTAGRRKSRLAKRFAAAAG